MTKFARAFASLALCCAAASSATAQEVTIRVKPNATGSGASWTDPAGLQAAINAAVANSTPTLLYNILLSRGVYRPVVTGSSRSPFAIGNAVNLRLVGGFAGGPNGSSDPDSPDDAARNTEIVGDPVTVAGVTLPALQHVLVISETSADPTNLIRVENVLIRGGRAVSNTGQLSDFKGGGVYSDTDAEVRLSEVLFVDNWAGAPGTTTPASVGLGGAVYAVSGNPDTSFKIRGCMFFGNYARRGGAVAYEGGADLRIGNSMFQRNGGIALNGLPLGAPVTQDGGALYLGPQTLSKHNNNTYFANSATRLGGAVFWDLSGPPDTDFNRTHDFFHCTFASNRVQGDPVQITYPAGVTVTNFVDQNQRGAGIHIAPGDQGTIPGNKVLTVNNSILWSQQLGPDIVVVGDAGNSGATVEVNFSDVEEEESPGVSGFGGVNLNSSISLDPLFENISIGDLRLSNAGTLFSPCINAGSNLFIGRDWVDANKNDIFDLEPLPVSLRPSIARIVQGTADMGAYEQ